MTENENFVTVDGKEVLILTPDYDRPSAIVDLSVIKRLASYLPKAKLHSIRREFTLALSNVDTIEEYVQVIEEELAFHKSVNLINEVKLPSPPITDDCLEEEVNTNTLPDNRDYPDISVV